VCYLNPEISDDYFGRGGRVHVEEIKTGAMELANAERRKYWSLFCVVQMGRCSIEKFEQMQEVELAETTGSIAFCNFERSIFYNNPLGEL